MTKEPALLLINKTAGMTSFDCVRTIKKAFQRRDVGHGGTLDKFATGLLPIFLGDGLKLARFFLEEHPTLPTYWKTYTGTFELGVATETFDPEGAITEKDESDRRYTLEEITEAMQTFVGRSYLQVPPKYSAKKLDGKRASDLMREGKQIELKACEVFIRNFVCTEFNYPFVSFEVECSKGTYIRSLAVDFAKKLGTFAYVKELRRTRIGNFSVDSIVKHPSTDTYINSDINGLSLDLLEASTFLRDFPILEAEVEQLRVGKLDTVATRLANSGLPPTIYRALAQTPHGAAPIALFELTKEKHVNFLRNF